jgi:hypothetical protein
VLAVGEPTASGWSDAATFDIDRALLEDPSRLEGMVDELQRRCGHRVPTVFVLDVDPEELNASETTDAPPYELGAEFRFLRERLTELIWHNSYDARSGELIWWWAHKVAARLDVVRESSHIPGNRLICRLAQAEQLGGNQEVRRLN